MTNPYPMLRTVAVAEGISFLVLLGIAMPLKYVWHLPIAVLIAGSIHGGLFLAFVFAWQRARIAGDWPTSRSVQVFVAALLPFGPFVLDRGLRRWEQDHLQRDRSAAADPERVPTGPSAVSEPRAEGR